MQWIVLGTCLSTLQQGGTPDNLLDEPAAMVKGGGRSAEQARRSPNVGDTFGSYLIKGGANRSCGGLGCSIFNLQQNLECR
jgi:hypothetical protein